jgi:eukaryotic-like serine/threonine-protein kinase
VNQRVLGGRYRIVQHVAKGGMAEVYLGHDQLLDRPVAVKVLVPDLALDATFVERFRREAQAAAGLNHHNIVSVYDFGQDDGAYFIVMEYVDGPTLREIIRADAPLPPERVIEIGSEISAGLAAAHLHGIVHRDMKPANVLVSETGTVKVADFGIARAAQQSAQEGLTMPGAVVGTATYLSPEQALGEPLDQRSDVYSLGMVLYEMLAGRPPFTGDSPVAIAYKQVNEHPPPPSTYNPDVPPALDRIVMRAMAKDPAARYPSAAALRADLLAVQFGAADPEPTRAAAGGAAAGAAPVVGPAEVTATSIAGSPTAMMPPPTGVDLGGGAPIRPPAAAPPVRPGPDPRVYRRRQLGVLALLLVAAIGVIALVSALGGGDDEEAAPVTVPSVVGLGVNDAQAQLDRVGLKSRIDIDDELTGEPDQVAEQVPPGGSQAREGDTVTLRLPSGSTETTQTTEAPDTTVEPTVTQAPTTQATTPPTTQPPATVAPTLPPTTAPPIVVTPTITIPPTTVATQPPTT